MLNELSDFAIEGVTATALVLTLIGLLQIGKAAALRNYLVVLALLVGSGVLWLAVHESVPQVYDQRDVFVAAPAYAALYLSMTIIVARVSRLRNLGPRASMLAAFLLVVALGVGVSMVLARAIEGSTLGPGFNILNPLIGMLNYLELSNSNEVASLLWLLVADAVLAVLFALMVLVFSRASDVSSTHHE